MSARTLGVLQADAGQVSVDEMSGRVGLSLFLPASPARELTPGLALGYAPDRGNGPFGLGFSLGLPVVARSTARGVPRYDDRDVFELDGVELLPTTTENVSTGGVEYTVTRYLPRVQGPRDRIERWLDPRDGSCFWRTVDADDRVCLFGLTAAGRIADPAAKPRIFCWLIEACYDDCGNVVVYEYRADAEADGGANRYLDRIRYGHATPVDRGEFGIGALPEGPWHVELVFDYGQLDPTPANARPYEPVREWSTRSDRIASYAAGFAVKTWRLCRHVLLFHRFEALGSEPVLVKVVRLSYEEDPVGSQLTRFDVVGYAKNPAGAAAPYEVAPLPPIELGYAPFSVEQGAFEPLTVTDGSAVPSFQGDAAYALVDLFGIAAVGILHADGEGMRFWPPAAAGATCFDPPVELAGFPIGGLTREGGAFLMDVEGDGGLDLVRFGPDGGAFSIGRDVEGSQGFSQFTCVPSEMGQAGARLVDASGSGRSDLIVRTPDGLRFYESLGRSGYARPCDLQVPADFPKVLGVSREELVTFADMFGTGGQHLVRVANGRVECWPSLGFGVFGAKVELGGAPVFGAAFDARRLLLADVDGSGTADLLYFDGPGVTVFRNQCGNSFASGTRLALPVDVDDASQASVLDLGGTGTQRLTVATSDPGEGVWAFAFNGGRRAFLLDRIDDALGSSTEITYASATRSYLEDVAAGRFSTACFASPVTVVDRVIRRDAISGTAGVTSFRYRHGRYDRAERRFLGFGMVECVDAEPIAGRRSAAGSRAAFLRQAEASSPVLARTWYDVGVDQEGLEKEWFAGDSAALSMPGTSFVWSSAGAPTAEAMRQARMACCGEERRAEIYGLDGDASQWIPYRVRESAVDVREAVPPHDGSYGSYQVVPRESIAYDYERRAADPSVEHSFVLAVDAISGEVKRAAVVAYARRGSVDPAEPAQYEQIVQCMESVYRNIETDAAQRLAIPLEQRHLRLDGLPAPAGGYYSWAQIAALVEAALSGSSPGLGYEVVTWRRLAYYDGLQALLRSAAEAVFSDSDMVARFGALLPGGELRDLLRAAGYELDTATGYWWSQPDVRTFHGIERFFSPESVTSPFGSVTRYAYDATTFAQIESTTAAKDVLDHKETVEIFDYRHLMPVRVLDANRTAREVRLDPLSVPIAQSRMGYELGEPVGFDPVLGDEWRVPGSISDCVEHASVYLGGAASITACDLFAWCGRLRGGALDESIWRALVGSGYISPEGAILRAFRALTDASEMRLPPELAPEREVIFSTLKAQPSGSPAAWVHVTAPDYPGRAIVPPTIDVDYCDGLYRPLQGKMLCPALEPGTRAPWATTGAVRYDARNRPIMQFEAFYSEDYRFVADPRAEQGVPAIFQYDALDRVTEVLTGKGFLRRSMYGAWWTEEHDEVDTVLESPFYAQHPGGEGLDPWEWQAIQKAVLLSGTPVQRNLGPLGHVVSRIDRDVAVLAAAALEPLGLDRKQAAEVVTALVAKGFIDDAGRLTIAFQPDEPGFSLGLPPQLAAYEAGVVAVMRALIGKGRDLVSRYSRDVLGRVLWGADPRLGARDVKALEYAYSMAGWPVWSRSGDAGATYRIADRDGQEVFQRDDRGVRVASKRDGLRRLRRQEVAQESDAGAARTALWYVYGDETKDGHPIVPDAERLNLVGGVYRRFDSAGMRQVDGYSMGGSAMAISQRFLADYAATVDWGSSEPTPESSWLETDAYSVKCRYDALNRLVAFSDPDRNTVATRYSEANLVTGLTLTSADGNAIVVVESISYEASAQPREVRRGNGITTRFRYDSRDRDLIGMRVEAAGATMQDAAYTYDPCGNMTHVADAAFVTMWGGDAGADGSFDYTYDALYRTLRVTGPVRAGYGPEQEIQGGYEGLVVPMRGSAMAPQALEQAEWQHAIDDGGNVYWTSMARPTGRWTSELVVADGSNRAISTRVFDGSEPAPQRPAERVVAEDRMEPFFDACGNQRRLDDGASLDWDYRDKLATVARDAEGGGMRQYLHEDAHGFPARRVQIDGALDARVVTDTRRLGCFEITKTTAEGTESIERRIKVFLRQELQAEVVSGGEDPGCYFRIADGYGSAMWSATLNGSLIDYEAYTPFGATAFAVDLNGGGGLATKNERFDAQARDRGTGLYRYPQRWYQPAARRWASPDPLGAVDGFNLFAYVGDNPASFYDPTGNGRHRKGASRWIPTSTQSFAAIDEVGAEIGAYASANPIQPSSVSTSPATGRIVFNYTVGTTGAPTPLWMFSMNSQVQANAVTGQRLTPYTVNAGMQIHAGGMLEQGVHGIRVGGRLPSYDSVPDSTTPADAAEAAEVMRGVRPGVPGNKLHEAVAVASLAEPDRWRGAVPLAAMAIDNMRRGRATAKATFKGNSPLYAGAMKRGGARVFKVLAGTSQFMKRSDAIDKIRGVVDHYVARMVADGAFGAARSSAEVRAILKDSLHVLLGSPLAGQGGAKRVMRAPNAAAGGAQAGARKTTPMVRTQRYRAAKEHAKEQIGKLFGAGR